MATHFYKIRLDQSARGREGAVMSDKFDQFEIQKEVSLLLDSLPPSEQRQVMAGLAERYGFKLADKAATTSKGYRPGYGRKRGRLTLRGQQPRRPTSREPQRADTVDAHGLEPSASPPDRFPCASFALDSAEAGGRSAHRKRHPIFGWRCADPANGELRFFPTSGSAP